ncbi:MAG: septum site-determining protein MinC [Clostridium sp.]|uniref:septum site-determining protein MinC n=1 Tax=Clostridium culturomicium TaxID=1499683 RepID=UPI00058F7A66|nr:septum site-determining protein MinC [Clostridium culturomicium]MDU4889005.1 septum site-determining protein MinC [Clostridium sp.]MDU7083351.1 septum site-determining protein MinC [Clostridium sp.]
MYNHGIKVKGEKEGLNLIVNLNEFNSLNSLIEAINDKLQKGKKFYKGATIKITVDVNSLDSRELRKIRSFLYDEFMIKDCTFVDIKATEKRVFSGINEGKTKFVKKTVRSGQRLEYPGNVVIIGDVNSGAEVYAAGNIIVLGQVKGSVFAGCNGNDSAIISAMELTPQVMKIGDLITRSPEDIDKPKYPEVAKIKNGNIVVEPYSVNKYI